MASLFDTETGQPVQLPDDQVQAALLSGKIGAPAGTPLTLLGRDGKPLTVPIEQAKQHFDAGAVYLGEEGAQNLEAEEKYGDRPLEAAGLGALDTLSFGTAPQALTRSGVIPRETYKGIEEHNPTATTGGKVLGAVAPIALTDGAAAPEEAAALGAGEAAEAGGALKAAADLLPGAEVSRLGGAAEKAVTGALGEGAGARAVGAAARGAVEAPLYSAGDQITENALDNKPLTAEALLAEAGPAALFGAGVGGAFEGALGLARQAAPAALERASGSLEKLSGKLEEASTKGRIGRVANALDSASAGIDQGVKEALAVKGDLVDMHLQGMPARPEAQAFVQQLRTGIDTIEDGGAYQKAAQKVLGKLEDELSGAKDAAQQFQAIDDAKRRLYPLTKFDKDAALNFVQREQLQPIRQAWSEAQRALEDTAVWGKAGQVQQEFNARFSAFQDAQDALGKRFMRKALGDEEGNRSGKVADLGKLGSFLKGSAEGTDKAAENARFLKGYLDGAKGLVDFASEASAELPTGRRNLHQVGGLIDQLGEAKGAAVKGLTPSPLEHLEHFLPHAVRGPIAAVGALSRNAEVIAHLAGKTAQYTKRIADGVRSVLDGASGGTVAGPVGALLTHHYGTEAKRGEDRHASLERHRTDLAQLTANPAAAAQRLTEATPELGRHAPAVAALVQQKAVQSASYLSSQLPRTSGTPNPFPGLPQPKASEAELAAYERKARAVQQPLSVLEDASRGRLTRDAVEAVQAVHGEAYKAMVDQVQQQIASRSSRVSYPARLQLSVLLGKPLEPTLQMIDRLQASLAPSAPPNGPAASTPAGGAGGLARQGAPKFAARASTSLNRTEGGQT